jgi:GNAT superfamily N-acetyltransferase
VLLIRKATREDVPRLFEIRGAVRENRLGDPGRVTVALCEWFTENSAFWLWVEEGRVQGFSAADPRNGSIFGLFVDPAYEGRGIGRKLLPLACETLRKAGYRSAIPPNHQRAPRGFIGGMAGSRSAMRMTDKSSSERKFKSVAAKLGHYRLGACAARENLYAGGWRVASRLSKIFGPLPRLISRGIFTAASAIVYRTSRRDVRRGGPAAALLGCHNPTEIVTCPV